MTLSYVLIGLAVLSYGVDGVLLTKGSQADGGALHSTFWWYGTMLQGVGFFLTFAARTDLPLLFVQAASVAALAVTALLSQLLGMHRLRWLDGLAIIGMIAGLTMLGMSTQPGPTTFVHPWTVPILFAALAASLVFLRGRWPAAWFGLLGGLGFGTSAIGARLLASSPGRVFWHFWEWSTTDWVHALLVPAGLVVGQVFLTKGLARRPAVTALGAMYLASTVWPILVGLGMLHENPRTGTAPLVVLGTIITLAAALRLVRQGPASN
ncbi:MAG TPA: hypothetical protein H9987_00335 [Candidatus Luteococcus avicola]|nr:hypothetical protein [Candidatus Luteococcus avicola]